MLAQQWKSCLKKQEYSLIPAVYSPGVPGFSMLFLFVETAIWRFFFGLCF
jgi:hypothetical protein